MEGIEEVQGPRGARVFRERGVLLGSAYDPDGEAQRMADAMASEPADVRVVIGFGLGEHLLRQVTRSAVPIVVYEPSLARLKAAFHRRAFDELFGSTRELDIATDCERLGRLVESRYRVGLQIRVFTHPAVLRLDPGRVREAVRRIDHVKHAVDSRVATRVQKSQPWALLTAANGRRIAERPGFDALEGAFAHQPAVVVAAGPSLDKQLPLLRERRDHLVVIAIGQTVGALAAAGIRPDLVHVLESRDVSHQLTDAGDPGDLDLVVTPNTHPGLFDLPTRSCFVATPGSASLGAWIARATGRSGLTSGGSSVAIGAVGLAMSLGADPILMIGQDLAFTDGRTYAAHSAYDFVRAEIEEGGRLRFTGMHRKEKLLGDPDLSTIADRSDRGRRVVWVDGWHEGERLPTWGSYAVFIEEYREVARLASARGIRLINCTEGGARLHGLDHRPFRELLDEVAGGAIDATSRIRAAYDSNRAQRLADYRPALGSARRTLDRFEKDAMRADRDAERIERGLTGLRREQQRVESLRKLAAHERKLRRRLERIPWLDSFAQQAIHQSECLSRRADLQKPDLRDLVGESRLLFRAVCEAVVQARDWLDTFEASFAEPTDSALPERTRLSASEHGAPASRARMGRPSPPTR